MAVTYYALLTTIGAGKLANATAQGTTLKITQLAVGDGGGTVPTPDAGRTALVNEVRRAPLNSLDVDPSNSSRIIAEQIIPADVGGWWLRELGLYDETGALVAYANCAPSYKPQLAEGSGRTQTVRMVLLVSNTSSVQLTVDPSVVLATRDYVDGAIVSAMNRTDYKQSVRTATTANITLSGIQSVDGVALIAGDRVLVKNQTTASENGIYVAATGAWKRSEDCDENAEVTPALTVSVETGTAQADTVWQLVTDAPIALGTTALTFQNITNGLARLASPAFSGNPTAPTPDASDNDTSLATTAFVRNAMAAYGLATNSLNSAQANDLDDPSLLSGLYFVPSTATGTPIVAQGGLIHRVYGAGGFQIFVLYSGDRTWIRRRGTSVWGPWRENAFLDSPVLSGVPTAPTAASDRIDTALANTAFVWNVLRDKIGLGSVTTGPSISDVDDATLSAGFYYVGSSTIGGPVAGNGMLLHKVYATGGFQLFQALSGDRLLFRRRASSTWQAWQELTTQVGLSTALGTVGLGVSKYQPNWPNASLNDCTAVVSGVYRSIATTTGIPPGYSLAITVQFWVRSADVEGTFQAVQSVHDASSGRSGWRICTGSGSASTPNWSAWKEVATTESPTLIGVPTAPTAAVGTNTTQLATTAFVSTAVANLVASAPASLDTLRELAAALGNDPNFATTMTNALAGKAGKATTLGGYGITDGAGKEGAAVALGHDGATAYVRRTDGGVHYVQTYLGFTPVRQGGGNGQGGNIVYLGWDLAGAGLRAQVDALDLGLVWTDRDAAIKALAATINTGAGGFASYGFFRNIAGTILGPGSTVAGSALSWSGGDDNQTSNSSPGGTWRLMGWTQGRSSNGAANSLYQRIA
ncbi:phage tail protein [Pseudomonas nitroreducens]|uniref:phage tail-collar fiber domain-containing protein n=1 Tax=Pseudomonas nitroreducens TaxID=46680 RepID=UPI0037F7BDD8